MEDKVLATFGIHTIYQKTKTNSGTRTRMIVARRLDVDQF